MNKSGTNNHDKLKRLYSWATDVVGGPGNMEKLSYLMFGGLTTAVNFAVFILFNAIINTDGSYLYANGIAWVAAVAFAFVTNKRYVFKSKAADRDDLLREIGSFTGARIVSLAFDYGFLLFAVEMLHMNKNIAKILSNVVVVVMNYFFSKMFIFRKMPSSAAPIQAPDIAIQAPDIANKTPDIAIKAPDIAIKTPDIANKAELATHVEKNKEGLTRVND